MFPIRDLVKKLEQVRHNE